MCNVQEKKSDDQDLLIPTSEEEKFAAKSTDPIVQAYAKSSTLPTDTPKPLKGRVNQLTDLIRELYLMNKHSPFILQTPYRTLGQRISSFLCTRLRLLAKTHRTGILIVLSSNIDTSIHDKCWLNKLTHINKLYKAVTCYL